MKILHLCKKYPPALGGDAVVVANLQKQQEALGHTVVIVTSNCAEIRSKPHIYKCGLVDTPAQLDNVTLRRMVSLIGLFFAMFAILRKERPDVIHSHSIDMAFFASFAARFYGIPMIHTFHMVTFYKANQPLLRRKSELWLAKGAGLQRATAPNTYDVKKLRTAGLHQTEVLPNGVDLPFWTARPHREVSNPFVFVTVGRLERQKGYEYLIRAAASLADMQSTPFRIVIVGEGLLAPKLKMLARQVGVQDSISFVGRKNPQEVRELFSQASAAVFPSLYETTPLTVLEAWAARVPVIVTPVGILHDAPADFSAAYVVPIKDEDALAKAMRQCMNDSWPSSTLVTEGFKEAKKYTWPHIAQTAEAIYRNAP